MASQSQFEKEIDFIEEQRESGILSQKECTKAIRETVREYQACLEEEARTAYDAVLENDRW